MCNQCCDKTVVLKNSTTVNNTILTGSGAPNDANGNDGDLYYDTSTGDLYQKASGTWGAAIDNLTGPTGPAGADGADGADGTGTVNDSAVFSETLDATAVQSFTLTGGTVSSANIKYTYYEVGKNLVIDYEMDIFLTAPLAAPSTRMFINVNNPNLTVLNETYLNTTSVGSRVSQAAGTMGVISGVAIQGYAPVRTRSVTAFGGGLSIHAFGLAGISPNIVPAGTDSLKLQGQISYFAD
jgi:hypothetical protein